MSLKLFESWKKREKKIRYNVKDIYVLQSQIY